MEVLGRLGKVYEGSGRIINVLDGIDMNMIVKIYLDEVDPLAEYSW